MPPKTRSTPNRDEDDSSESGTQEPTDAAGAGEGSSTRASPDAGILPPAPAGGAADICEFMRAMTAMMETFSRQIATTPGVASAAPMSLPRPRLSVPTPTYAGYSDGKSVRDFLQDLDAMPPWRNRPRGPYPGGPPDRPGPGAAGPQWSGRPNPRGGRPGRRQHRGWPNGGAGQRRPGSAGTASPAAGRPARHGAGPSAATSRHQAEPPATEPPHHGAGPSTTGGPAWSRPPCHTVATWTAWEEGGAVHFVTRRRWKHQPRPTPGQPDHQVPLPFRGHTQPAVPRVLGAPDTCWLCGVPIIHRETHEAGRLHSDLLEAQPLPDNVAAAVQTLRASRPDLLAPAALASVQPARPPENPAAAPAAAAAVIEPATTTAPTTSAATTSCGSSHRASVVHQPPPSPSTSDDAIMAEVEQLLGQNQ
ncbi:transcription initiation factor TFIID subunit 4-like [Ixodes scapularis]